jgi:uncharacterized protein YcbK (DUF882 family)
MTRLAVATLLLLGLALGAGSETPPAESPPPDGDATPPGTSRFFVAGGGTLTVVRVAGNERAQVRYRRPDGTYDPTALATLSRTFRDKAGNAGPIEPRFVELLAWLQQTAGGAPLRLLSGYRSPAYNEGLRKRGRKAASGSMHTEGMAADLVFPKQQLHTLWLAVRALECCGAGKYVGNGFMHVDTGQPRFWEPATAKTDENLSAGNARAFARTEYDRYEAGEPIAVALHGVTAPPIRLVRSAELVPEGATAGTRVTVLDVAETAPGDGCIEADARTRLRVTGAAATARGTLVLEVCEPRLERTPAHIATNPIAVR